MSKAMAKLPPDALYHEARKLQQRGLYPEALEAFKLLSARVPDQGETYYQQGRILFRMGKPEEALVTYRQALERSPGHPDILNAMANCHYALGDRTEALAQYEQVLAAHPRNSHALYNRVQLAVYAPDEPRLKDLISLYGSADGEDKARLGFALGKVYEQVGDYARAFSYVAEANAVKHRLLHYAPQPDLSVIDAIERIFTPEFFAARTGWGSDDKTAVFVVGMPRSGSTLIEQILASHPAVYGAGEVEIMPPLAMAAVPRQAGAPFPEGAAALKKKDIRPLAMQYVRQLKALAPRKDAPHIVDKMLNNYLYIGLIHLLLPNARIIHAVRDPMDTCWSIFRHYFSGRGHGYSYHQEHLGAIYCRYLALMRHWHRVLPGIIHDASYEALIERPEEQTRALLSHCGLSWDERCLRFYETKRSVATASALQVRQPLYRTSFKSWEKVADQLAPLKQALYACS